MPSVPSNFGLSFNIVRCSHVEYGVTDLDASRRFYVDTLGMIETELTDDTRYLRALEERNHHSYVLRRSTLPTVFRVAPGKDLNALKE